MTGSKKQKIIECLCCMAFYLIFLFADGVYLGSDSRGYIEMIPAREPLYPLFLAALRAVFKEDIYLYAAAFIQCLLAGYAVFMSTGYLTKRLGCGKSVEYLIWLVHAGTALLTRFASERGAVYPVNIMTEGLTMSLWIIFFTLSLRALYSGNIKSFILPLLLAALMMDIRKQMAVLFIAFTAAVFVTGIRRFSLKTVLKRTLAAVGISVMAAALAVCITRIYNFCLRGEFVQNTRDMNLVLTTSLYVADKEDAALIKEEGARELFCIVMDETDKSESNIAYAPKDWEGLAVHYEDHYEVITLDKTKDLFEEYATAHGAAPGLEAQIEADRLSSVMVKSLLKANAPRYLKIYAASLLTGMINSIAHRGGIINIFAGILYVLYIILLVICITGKVSEDVQCMAGFVLLLIISNVGVTAALIFCQSRYMIYNMPLFYISLMMMALKLKDAYLSKGKV